MRITVITCITIVAIQTVACGACTVTFLTKIFRTCPHVPWVTATNCGTASPTTSGTSRVTCSVFIRTAGFTFSIKSQPAVLLQAICSSCGLTCFGVHSSVWADTDITSICTVIICVVASNPQARIGYRTVSVTAAAWATDVVISIACSVLALVEAKFVKKCV